MTRIAVPVAVASVLMLTMVVPTLRVWRRTGVWPVVFRRDADPFQRLMGGMMGLLLGAALGWGGAFAWVGPEPLRVWLVPTACAAVGWAAVVAGAVVVIAAQIQMGASWRIGIDDRPTELVTRGLFGVVRNPIFSGLLMSLLGLVLITPSPWTVMGFLMISALIGLQTRLEEAHLVRSHGAAYREYAARLGRFVPGLGRLRRTSRER